MYVYIGRVDVGNNSLFMVHKQSDSPVSVCILQGSFGQRKSGGKSEISWELLVYCVFNIPLCFLDSLLCLSLNDTDDSAEHPATRLVNACEFFFLVSVAESQMGYC